MIDVILYWFFVTLISANLLAFPLVMIVFFLSGYLEYITDESGIGEEFYNKFFVPFTNKDNKIRQWLWPFFWISILFNGFVGLGVLMQKDWSIYLEVVNEGALLFTGWLSSLIDYLSVPVAILLVFILISMGMRKGYKLCKKVNKLAEELE